MSLFGWGFAHARQPLSKPSRTTVRGSWQHTTSIMLVAAHDEHYAGREFEDVEPTLRSEYETDVRTCTGGARGSGGERWEQLREEVREGWNRAHNR